MKTDSKNRTVATQLVLETPVGPLVLEGDATGLTHIYLPGDPAPTPGTTGDEGEPAVIRAATQLEEYFAGERTEFDLALVARGTPFQQSVWFALADIPYGKTISYAELAAWVGRPTAFRAVGQANGANPLPIVLPCHRVVATGGGIGGYGGGLDMKRRLLAHENCDLVG